MVSLPLCVLLQDLTERPNRTAQLLATYLEDLVQQIMHSYVDMSVTQHLCPARDL